MTKSEGQETFKLRTAAEAQTLQAASEEPPVLTPPIYFPRTETIPPGLSPFEHIHHFRAPPILG